MCSFSSSYQAVFKKKGSKLSNRIIHWIPVNQPNIGHKLPSQENELILKSVRNDHSEACQFGLKNNGHHFLNDIWGVRTLRVSWQRPNPSSFSLLSSVTFAKSLNLCPPLPIFKLELFYWLYKAIVRGPDSWWENTWKPKYKGQSQRSLVEDVLSGLWL